MITLSHARLSLPPLVARELLGAGRRKSFFWLRGGLALVAGIQGYEMLNHGVVVPSGSTGPGAGGGPVLHHMAELLFMVSLLMGFMGADSINRERREGTLGLLLLTGLTPMQVVRGKLLSCGVTSFLVLLGALPALMFPVLIGGARGSDGVMIGLGVLNAMFVSLAAGLWMSALVREQRYALLATLVLVAALAFGAQVIGVAVLGARAVDAMRLFGLGGWITAASLPQPVVIRFVVFFLWFSVAHAVGWWLLARAATTLSRNWQDSLWQHQLPSPPPDPWVDWTRRAPSAISGVWVTEDTTSVATKDQPREAVELGEASITPVPPEVLAAPASVEPRVAPDLATKTPLPNPRPWDGDPIRWQMERLGSPQGIIWLAVLADFVAQFGALGGIFNGSTAASGSWGLLSFAGMVVMVASSGALAWAGARFFQHAARQQDLELLLTTPVGGANILSGQWHVLWHGLRWPLCAVLAVVLPAGISMTYDLMAGHPDTVAEVLPPFLIGVNLVVEAVALCWVGMLFGLRSRNVVSAVLWTIGLVQLLPLALSIAGMWGWAYTGGSRLRSVGVSARMPPVVPALLFFLVKNAVLVAWAPIFLRRGLRLGARAVRLNLPARSHARQTS